MAPSPLSEWITILSLLFGGCCSNAWTLELVTSLNPDAGSLITFAQFFIISLYGLLKHLRVECPISERRLISKKDVTTRIVLDVLEGRIGTVVVKGLEEMSRDEKDDHEQLDFIGVLKEEFKRHGVRVEQQGQILRLKNTIASGKSQSKIYTISIVSKTLPLTNYSSSLVLELSGCEHVTILIPPSRWNPIGSIKSLRLKKRKVPVRVWLIQVVLFFFISLLNNAAFGYAVPMGVHIIFRSGGLVINMLVGWAIGRRRQIFSVLMVTVGVMFTTLSASGSKQIASRGGNSATYGTGIAILTLALILSGFLGLAQDWTYARYGRGKEHGEESLFYLHMLSMPGFVFFGPDIYKKWRDIQNRRFYMLLALNVLTQFVCVSAVNQLSGRVTSLTVTLVLAVRKAVSLLISLKHGESWMMWIGAALVFGGTVVYTL